MPILVIEGCDGTGKSTLAEKCAELARSEPFYDVRLEHYGVPKYDPLSDLSIGAQAMNQLLERFLDFNFLTDFVVVDRFHWGEPVYAPVFRPERCVDPLFGTLTHSEFYYVEDWLRSVGAVTVYCSAPAKVILDRVVTRGEPDLINDSGAAEERTMQILERYESLKTYVTHPNRREPGKVVEVELLKPSDTDFQAERLVQEATSRAVALHQAYRERMDGAFKGSRLVSQLKPTLMEVVPA